MRRKYFKLLFLLLLCLSLISCGKKEPSPKDDLTLVLPDGKSITLYMDREEVEKIIGEPTQKPDHGVYRYETFTIAYTENKLSFILITGEGYKTKSGISIGADLETLNLKNFTSNSKDTFRKDYAYKDSNFSLVDLPKINDIKDPFDYVAIDISISENKVEYICIADTFVNMTAQFDD